MGKPPNALSELLVVLLGWRSKEVALVLDLTKAYQSIKTPGETERNVRRLVWRWGDKKTDWKIYRWMVVTFGDQLASLILELCKNRAAELGWQLDPEAADLLKNSMYVDDLCGGGSPEQVARLGLWFTVSAFWCLCIITITWGYRAEDNNKMDIFPF